MASADLAISIFCRTVIVFVGAVILVRKEFSFDAGRHVCKLDNHLWQALILASILHNRFASSNCCRDCKRAGISSQLLYFLFCKTADTENLLVNADDSIFYELSGTYIYMASDAC